MNLSMMLDKVVFICVMFFNHTDASLEGGRFYVSETKSTWTDMGSICAVGEPSFRFLSGTNVVGNCNISDIENNAVWVGYFEVMEYFYYTGCLNKHEVQNAGDVIANNSGGSPGQCYRQCGYGVLFGLMNSQCFCFRDDPTLLNVSSVDSNCNRSCTYQPGVACGGSDSLSVYKYHSLARDSSVEPDTLTNNNKFCLRLNPLKLHYSWTNCIKDHVVVCDVGGNYVQPTIPASPHSWIDSAQKCFSGQALLLPVEHDIVLKEKTNTDTWTKLIKSPVIYSFNSFDKALFKARVIRYGFVARKGNRCILRFTVNMSYRNVICLQESEAFSRLETVVGISVAAGVLAALVFSIAILKIRRKKKEPETNTSESCDLPFENSTDVPLASPSKNLPSEQYVSINSDLKTKHHNYELVTDEISEQLPNHNYYILENIYKTESVGEMACSSFTLGSSHDGNNKQLKENIIKEKATTSDLCNEGKSTEVNVYDKCFMDKKNAYDHVCISGNNVTWKADKTYDTTI